MPAEKGSAFLLKIGNGAQPAVFATVAGMRTTQMSVNGEGVNVTSKDSGGWRELLSGAGVRSVSVAASGIFTGSAAEGRVKTNAPASSSGRLGRSSSSSARRTISRDGDSGSAGCCAGGAGPNGPARSMPAASRSC